MTKQQVIKAMQTANIKGEVTGKGSDWEVELADDKTMNSFTKKVASVGGFKTGYGAWILRPGYVGNGDYMDKSSRWHY